MKRKKREAFLPNLQYSRWSFDISPRQHELVIMGHLIASFPLLALKIKKAVVKVELRK